MPKPQRLAPRGLNEAVTTAADVLSEGRYESPVAAKAEPAPTPAPVVAKPASTSGAPRRGRGDTEGMTRRTYYLQAADADALESAVARIYTRLNSAVPKHRILGAIIAEGLDNLDTITTRLKDELVAGLD